MTEETQTLCLEMLAGMQSPAQKWTEAVGSLYILAMQGWADDIAVQAVRHAALTEQYRPSPAVLRQIAARLVAPVPPAAALRAEVRDLLVRHGGARAHLAPTSHPVVALLADELGGWRVLGRMETAQIDQAFPGAYQRAVAEFEAKAADELLALPPRERAARLAPVDGDRKALAAPVVLDDPEWFERHRERGRKVNVTRAASARVVSGEVAAV